MRRQDELIALYQGRGRHAQKYLLSQMGRLALGFDSEELLEFLQGQIAHEDPVVAGQALFSLLEFLPAYVQKRYAIRESTTGAWTQLHMDAGAHQAALAKAERLITRATELAGAATLAARPLAAALMEHQLGAVGWVRTAALITLGQFDLKSVRERLGHELAHGPPDLVVARSVARLNADDFGPTLELVRKKGREHPDLYLLLSGAPAAQAFGVLMDAAADTDTVGRMNLAQALGTLRGVDTMAAFERLAGPNEGWVIVTLLDALERLGVPAAIGRLRQVYEAMEDEFVRVQAVRAAGGLRGPASVEFCLEATREGGYSVRAAALESLARLSVPPDKIAAAARRLVDAPHLKARVNAILAMLSPEEALGSRPLTELLMSSDPLGRLEAAYCLGYLQSPRGLGLLTALASLDPSNSVRQQAAKSLSRYPAADALPALIQMVQSGPGRLSLIASRALTRYGTGDAEHAVAAVTAALEATPGAMERALLYRSLGALAQRTRTDLARGALAAGLSEPDPKVLAGVLEGWNLVGAQGEGEVMRALRRLASPAEPRLRARALMALWSAGDLSALEGLGEMIAAGDENVVHPALECALEIGLLVPDALEENRFPALVERLLEEVDTPGYAAAAQVELGRGGERTATVVAQAFDDAFEVRRTGDPSLPMQEVGEQEDDAPEPPPSGAPLPDAAEDMINLMLSSASIKVPVSPPPEPASDETLPPTPRAAAETLPPPPATLVGEAPLAEPPSRAEPVERSLAPFADPDATMAEAPAPTEGPGLTLVGTAPPTRPAVPTGRATRNVPVQRRTGVNAALDPPTRAPAAPPPRGPVDILRSFLAGLGSERAGSLNDSLSKSTYLIADRIEPAKTAPVSRAPRAPAPRGGAPAARSGRGKLVAAAGVLVALAGWWGSRGPSQPEGLPGHIWVEAVEGSASTLKNKKLEARVPLEPGDAVKTGERSSLTLVTAGGDHVTLQAESGLSFVGVEPGGAATNRLLFANATGEVALDFKKTGDLELRAGPRRIRAGRAFVLVARDRRAPSLTVVSGSASLTHEKGGEPITLRSGDTIGLE